MTPRHERGVWLYTLERDVPIRAPGLYGKPAPLKAAMAAMKPGDSLLSKAQLAPSRAAKGCRPEPSGAVLRYARDFGYKVVYAPAEDAPGYMRVWRTA
jgi:hypothetical protein